MKVVRSLAYYLQSRGLLSEEEIAELKRKGFLENIEPGEQERPEESPTSQAGEPLQMGDEPTAAAKPRGRGRPRRPGGGLPELEASLRPILPGLETELAHLKPLASQLGLRSEPSDWPRLFEEAGERLRDALRDTIAGGKLKFAHLWRVIGEDPWQQVSPPEQPVGAVWSAWRVLLSSQAGHVPAAYRWILRSDLVRLIYQRMQLQRVLVRAFGAVFAETPDVLWRAVTRPHHEAGFLSLSFAYTAALNRGRGVPIRVAFKTEWPEDRCFAIGADGAVAVPAAGGGVRIFPPDGPDVAILDHIPDRIEALALHPSGERLYISRTDATGVNRVVEVEFATGAQRTLFEAYAAPQGPVCVDREKSVLYYRPAGISGFRLFRPDVAGCEAFHASPYPIDPANDFGFLPAGRYFGAVVRRTPALRQYRVWDWSDGTVVRTFELGPDPPNQRAVHASNPQRRILAYCTPACSEIYDTEDMKVVVRDEHDPFTPVGYGGATFSNDGRWLVQWSARGEMLAWDWSAGTAPVRLYQPSTAPLLHVAIVGNFAAGFWQLQEERGPNRRGAARAIVDTWNLETGEWHARENCQMFPPDRSWLWGTGEKLGLVRLTERDPALQVNPKITLRRLPRDKPFEGVSLEVWWPFPGGKRRAMQLVQDDVPGDLIDAWLFPGKDVVLLRFRLADGQVELIEFSLTEERVTSRRTVSLPRFYPVLGCNDDLDLGTGRQLDFYDSVSGERSGRWSIQARTRPVTSMKVVDGALVACLDGQSLVLVDLASGALSAEVVLPPADGPHRLLAVEGGGVSGVLALVDSGRVLRTAFLGAAGSEVRSERQFPSAGATGLSAGPAAAAPLAAFGARGQLELTGQPFSEERPVFLHPEDGNGAWILAFSPADASLAAVRKEEIRLWSSDGRALCRRLFLSEQPIAAQYSPDGETLWVADADGTFWKIAVDGLPPPPGASPPAWDLPGRDVLMQSWTVAQRMSSIESGDWLPLLAAVCAARDAGSRLGYGELGLFAPAIWAAG